MSVFEKPGWFRLELPEGWEADGDEDPVSVYQPEGPGALQVSAQAPRPLPPGGKIDAYLLLRAFLKQTGVEFDDLDARRYSERGYDWASCEYEADDPDGGGLLWRAWMATNHDLVVFLSYCCREEDRDRERAAVDAIIASLELK